VTCFRSVSPPSHLCSKGKICCAYPSSINRK
jgi:hypothetical protein